MDSPVHPSTDAATKPAAKKRVQNTSRSAHSSGGALALRSAESKKAQKGIYGRHKESSSRKESGISGE